MTLARRKEIEFERLVDEAKGCVRCPRMANSTCVIGPASGPISSPILIIGEALGRLGADASAIPFHGDKAGDNFESLLEQVGLSRHDCFITNAALCNPKDEKGNNATPNRTELQNCSAFLKRQIDLVDPSIVVTLGAQALATIRSIEEHEIELSGGVRKKWNWYGRTLVPLYHPGQRAMIHRSFHNQLADYQFLAETCRRLKKRSRQYGSAKASSQTVAEIASEILGTGMSVSYFALHKLFYLAEYEHYSRTRQRLTSAYIVRQKDGPYVFELNVKKLKKALPQLEIWTEGDRLLLRMKPSLSLFDSGSKLDATALDVVNYILRKYGKSDDAELKRVVYLTRPMRQILADEKRQTRDTFNRPIDFSLIQRGN